MYDDLLNKPGLIECMDTSSLPQDNLYYTQLRKKTPELFFQTRRMGKQC